MGKMRKYLNEKLIIETLKAQGDLAFTPQELSRITKIPLKTLKSQLKHLYHDGRIHKKTVEHKVFNAKGTERYTQNRVWYYVSEMNDMPTM